MLTPVTFTKRAELPPTDSLRGELLLVDCGYFDRFIIGKIIAVKPNNRAPLAFYPPWLAYEAL